MVRRAQSPDAIFWKSYARALAGALIFSFPLLMTMEMWWLGFYLDQGRLALFILVLLAILFGLARYSGFRKTQDWFDYAVDSLVAFSAGVLVAVVFLMVFGVLKPYMSLDEWLGKIALLAVPGSMGAIIASRKLGSDTSNDQQEAQASYGGELFIMGAGSLYLAFNVAPTEEMVLIAYQMSLGHSAVLVLLSLLIMHALVYSLEFKGQHPLTERPSLPRLVLFYTISGYALALIVSAYVLWTFGRFAGLDVLEVIATTAVLGFPAALGASTARLVI